MCVYISVSCVISPLKKTFVERTKDLFLLHLNFIDQEQVEAWKTSMAYRGQVQGWWQSYSNSFPGHHGQSMLFLYSGPLSWLQWSESAGELRKQWFSTCDPWASSTSISREPVRTACSHIPIPSPAPDQKPWRWVQVNLVKLGVRAIVLKSAVH